MAACCNSAGSDLGPRRALGKTGLSVSPVGLGGCGIGGIYGAVSDEEAISTVHRALERGVNFLDTSPLYMESERRMGVALKSAFERKLVNREDLVICSKVGDDCPPHSDNGGHHPMSKAGCRSSVEHSLELFGLEKLDVVLLHDPTLEEVEMFCDAREGGLAALRELRSVGKVGFFGIGCVEHEQQRKFFELAAPDCSVILTVNDYNLVRRYAATGNKNGAPAKVSPSSNEAGSVFEAAQTGGVGILNAGALYMGLLGDPATAWSNGGFLETVVRTHSLNTLELAQEIQKWWTKKTAPGSDSESITTFRTLALQFAALSNDAVSCVPIGCKSAAEVDDICDALCAERLISADTWQEFHSAFDSKVYGLDWQNDHWRYDKTSLKFD